MGPMGVLIAGVVTLYLIWTGKLRRVWEAITK